MAKLTKNNCLTVINPTLCIEWDYNKNYPLKPDDFSYSSTRIVWWKCKKCGKQWTAQIRHRNKGWYKCSCCKSMSNLNPELAKDWHPTKNKELTPCDVTRNDKRVVWWKCLICGNEWMACISNRKNGQGCPNHNNGVLLKDGTYCDSMVEAFYYLKYKKEDKNFIHNKKYSGRFEDRRYDFYLPKLNKYVEVTSYGKNNYPPWFKKSWNSYLKNIQKKERYVKNILKANFEFIQKILTPLEKQLVKNNMRVLK